MEKGGKKINKQPSGRNIMNSLKLYFALSIAGIFAVPENTFAQTNNNIKYEYKINKIKLADYKEMIKKRDIHFSKLDASLMDPKNYFVYNQKMMFLRSCEINKYGMNDLIRKTRKIIKTDLKQDVSLDPIEILELALQIISTGKGTEDLALFSENIGDDFDESMVNAVGYIQSLMPSLRKELDGTKMPTWHLDHNTLRLVIDLLENGEYTIEFHKAEENLNKGNNKYDSGSLDAQDFENEKNKLEGNTEDKLIIKKEKKLTKKNKTIITDNEGEIKEKNTKKEESGSLNADDFKAEIELLENDDTKMSKIKVEDIKVEDIKNSNESLKNYDFKEKLNSNLGTVELKQEINKLIREYIVVKHFVEKLKKIDINFDKGDEINVAQTALVLEIVDGDFEAGNSALEKTIDEGLTGNSAIIMGINKKLGNKYKKNNKIEIENNNGKINNIKVEEATAEDTNTVNFGGIDIKFTEDMFTNKNLDIVNSMSWTADILSKKLDKNKLNGVTYQQIINVINGFKSNNLKRAFMYMLLNNNVTAAQSLIGMELDCDYRYNNYVAKENIGTQELNKIKKLGNMRKYMGGEEIMANKHIPQDVKDAYQKLVNGDLSSKGRPYSIISKTDFKVYMFSVDHKLLDRHNTLLGQTKGDQICNPFKGIKTTPGGMYEIGRKLEESTSGEKFFTKYGSHYIVLIPMDGQYKLSKRFSFGFHSRYKKDLSRKNKLKSTKSSDKRASLGGCVNLEDEYFGLIYNHVDTGDIVYVTYEPSDHDIQKFTKQKTSN